MKRQVHVVLQWCLA